MPALTIMIQGTASSVGKSVLVAGFCRMLRRRGVRVAPFKSQNMSLNAAVTADGGEIGRAQAMQAIAAGVEARTDMNPILLKPEADVRSQVIVNGRVYGTLSDSEYEREKARLWPLVCGALERLRASYDVVVIEGAGSPAEINLNATEIVNMRVAREAGAPVLLVGDIDRGGVFAALLGTIALLEDEDRARVAGLIINLFRGDPTLLGDGPRQLERLTGKPVLEVVPYLADPRLPEEDSVALDERRSAVPNVSQGTLDLAMIRVPALANFDDFDPFEREPGVSLRYVQEVVDLDRQHAILLPGTKNTLAALAFLDASGLSAHITQLAADGVLVGLCGGYQLLGTWVADPLNIEGESEDGAPRPGLGLLPVTTTLEPAKMTRLARGRVRSSSKALAGLAGHAVEGYEIHMGRTRGLAEDIPKFLDLVDDDSTHPDGACANHGHVWGTYLHGIFTADGFRCAWLDSLRALHGLPSVPSAVDADGRRDPFDALAAHLERHLALNQIWLLLDL
jgi:adenosylcobyric acid synthase